MPPALRTAPSASPSAPPAAPPAQTRWPDSTAPGTPPPPPWPSLRRTGRSPTSPSPDKFGLRRTRGAPAADSCLGSGVHLSKPPPATGGPVSTPPPRAPTAQPPGAVQRQTRSPGSPTSTEPTTGQRETVAWGLAYIPSEPPTAERPGRATTDPQPCQLHQHRNHDRSAADSCLESGVHLSERSPPPGLPVAQPQPTRVPASPPFPPASADTAWRTAASARPESGHSAAAHASAPPAAHACMRGIRPRLPFRRARANAATAAHSPPPSRDSSRSAPTPRNMPQGWGRNCRTDRRGANEARRHEDAPCCAPPGQNAQRQAPGRWGTSAMTDRRPGLALRPAIRGPSVPVTLPSRFSASYHHHTKSRGQAKSQGQSLKMFR